MPNLKAMQAATKRAKGNPLEVSALYEVTQLKNKVIAQESQINKLEGELEKIKAAVRQEMSKNNRALKTLREEVSVQGGVLNSVRNAVSNGQGLLH